MPLIEGVGDEVTQFFIIVLILLVGIIAWQSTGLSDRQIIRTVLILERRSRHRVVSDLPVSSPTTTASSLESSIDTGQAETQTPDENQENEAGGACHICDKENSTAPVASSSSESVNDPNCDSPEIIQGDLDSNHCNIVEATTSAASLESDIVSIEEELSSQNDNSSESALLRRRRLAFFQSRQTTLLENPIIDQLGNNPSTSSHVNNDHIDPSIHLTEIDGASNPSSTNVEPPPPGNIRIRLKYLNDDQKLVEGKLQEQLGDFKRRHFALEMAADKLVRLIFNGQVLQSDNETLQDYGLFDNCVVHCLVQKQRSPSAQGSEGTRRTPTSPHGNMAAAEGIPQREWDLGNILFASLSILVGLAWYCRYQYAQLFNATTTVALVGLTGILTVSLVGIYLPDQDGLRR